MNLPKISIVTVTFNAEAYVLGTMESVFSQTYTNWEYILVDGRSTDQTMLLVEKHKSRFAHIISEPDKGIYDAMNKGLKLAKGEYIIFMNAGDRFANSTVLENIFNSTSNADVYYGDTHIIDSQWNVLGERRLRPPKLLTSNSFQMGMLVSHQSFIARTGICPPFSMQYKYSADFDWCIRVMQKSNRIENTQLDISHFMQGGQTSRTKIRGLLERMRIMIKHYGFVTTIFNHFRILIRLIFS